MERLRVVKGHIAEHGMKLKSKKCSFAQRIVKLLGHVVDQNGIYVDPDKVYAIKEFPRLISAT